MCTVTYVPTPRGFILTHNRDEAPTRSPLAITEVKKDVRTWIFPRDTGAGGTWIVTDDSGHAACLLNGAFVKHAHRPPYRRSRGLILLDCMEADDPYVFLTGYDFTGIEPFTLLLFSAGTVREMRWDGLQLHSRELPVDQTHFWCSATLYPPDMQGLREQIFRNWLASDGQGVDMETLLALHRTGSVNDPENDYVMNRQDRVRTVSITQVIKTENDATMRYFDLLDLQEDVRTITLRREISLPRV